MENIDEFLKTTNSRLFQILLLKDNDMWCWTGQGGMSKVEESVTYQDMRVFSRASLKRQYEDAFGKQREGYKVVIHPLPNLI